MKLKAFFLATAVTLATTLTAAADGGFTAPDSIRTQVLERLESLDFCNSWTETQARIHFQVDEVGNVQVMDVQTPNASLKSCILKKLDRSQLAIPAQKAERDYWITVTFRVV